ncbi:FecR family protein [Butyricimonas virosa]|jgi:transmembrane sensor|uniref:FecR family protein n=1 Tax=Butyricimonas virosa TaxID=544645 RepID=UPI00241DB17B|nr:FecR family protein [Butyricimonas virosa]MCI7294813.1 FecR domain-containing protein [Butyricimonas virosa]MDY6219143.1 FecR domain-containing protein [Butyricimonas virosa]
MEHQYSDRIVRLLQLYLLGDITEEERQELEDWCEEAPRNRKLFEQICQEDLFSKERYVYEKIHDTKAFSVFEKRVRKVSSRSIGNWWKYAAVLLFPILVVGSWKLMHETEQVSIVASSVAPIQPGCSQAVLVLDDGRKVFLKEEEEGVISEDKEITVTGEKDRLVYTSSEGKNVDEIRFNELEVPRGGEYKVRLADGTLVYLNSATRMKYPVKFDEKERKVYLSGEAYFEVAKDPERPFFVEMEGVEVRVYGTSFNVNTHQEGNIQTVLVKGSIGVKVLSSGMESMIRPGQMAEFKQGNTKVDVKDVNVAVYTDWKDGIFRFENQRLEDILAVLSNWYDMNVFYQTVSVKELHFSGYMERYKDVSVILEAITLSTGVTFSIQGKTIIVSK